MDNPNCSFREEKYGYCKLASGINQRCGHFPDCAIKKKNNESKV